MKLSYSAEVNGPAYPAFFAVQRAFYRYMERAFSLSELSALECEILYVPIVMPADMKSRYPARSKLKLKERLYSCCPQLDYEVFVSGTLKAQLSEYVRGLYEALPFLCKLGASPEQEAAFRSLLDSAVDYMVANHLTETRH